MARTLVSHHLSLTPFRKAIRDYEMICDSYYQAIRSSSPAQIEAIDMGRRGLHNEAAELLMKRLEGKLDPRFRYGPADLHADLRASLEGLTRGRAPARNGSTRFCSSAR